MTILEMSVSAALFILAATVIRALAIHKLPHKSFLLLWGIALVLLFLPLRIPSPISLFTLMAGGGQAAPAPVNLPALTGQGGGGMGGFAPVPNAPAPSAALPAAAPSFWAQISPLMLVWLAGCLLCAGFFLFTHLRCRSRYKMSLPCENGYVKTWLAAHPLRRTVQVRVSDQVSAPLTYGVLRPVILLPKGIDWANTKQMDYILTHEWMHICRFDVAFKFLLVAAVCLHWFNPLVWVLFVLAGRDIELACDEAVVRATGIERKKDYALALISLEERKSRFAPLCTSFSKNGVEERIKGIMKWKKTTVVSVAVALLLVVGTATVFATSAMAKTEDPAPAGGDGTPVLRYAPQGEAGNHSGYTEADYTALMALKTAGYREETLADFNARFRPLHTRYSGYNRYDENIEFLVTLGYSSAEIVYGENDETPMDMVHTAVNHNTNSDQYYGAEMDYEVQWEIADPAKTTVGVRDNRLNRCHTGIQAIFEEKSWDALNSTGIMGLMQRDCDALAKELSDGDIKVTVAVQGVNSAADDADFVQREYPLLLELRPEGYQDMTINAFRDAVHQKMSEDEDAYMLELDRATRDNRMERTRYTYADAAFVMNTLAPLAADGWKSWQYGGYFEDEAGMAEYQFTLTILDADTLTVGEHTGVWQGMATAIGSAFQNAPKSLWQDMAGMENLLEKAAQAIIDAEDRAVQVEMRYISYLSSDEWPEEGEQGEDVSREEIPPATDEQYEMLLALAAPGYQSMTAADFRAHLLETYSADEEAYLYAQEAVAWDMAFERVNYPLTPEQDYFLRTTLRASDEENAEKIRAQRTGEEKNPFLTRHVFRERTGPLPGAPAYNSRGELMFMVSVDYTVEWHIADPTRLTVAQRDAALSGVIQGIEAYIDGRTEDELVGGQGALQTEIDRLVAQYSSTQMKLTVADLHYDVLDERALFEEQGSLTA